MSHPHVDLALNDLVRVLETLQNNGASSKKQVLQASSRKSPSPPQPQIPNIPVRLDGDVGVIHSLCSATGTGCQHVVQYASHGHMPRRNLAVWSTNTAREPMAQCVLKVEGSKLKGHRCLLEFGTDNAEGVIVGITVATSLHPNTAFHDVPTKVEISEYRSGVRRYKIDAVASGPYIRIVLKGTGSSDLRYKENHHFGPDHTVRVLWVDVCRGAPLPAPPVTVPAGEVKPPIPIPTESQFPHRSSEGFAEDSGGSLCVEENDEEEVFPSAISEQFTAQDAWHHRNDGGGYNHAHHQVPLPRQQSFSISENNATASNFNHRLPGKTPSPNNEPENTHVLETVKFSPRSQLRFFTTETASVMQAKCGLLSPPMPRLEQDPPPGPTQIHQLPHLVASRPSTPRAVSQTLGTQTEVTHFPTQQSRVEELSVTLAESQARKLMHRAVLMSNQLNYSSIRATIGTPSLNLDRLVHQSVGKVLAASTAPWDVLVSHLRIPKSSVVLCPHCFISDIPALLRMTHTVYVVVLHNSSSSNIPISIGLELIARDNTNNSTLFRCRGVAEEERLLMAYDADSVTLGEILSEWRNHRSLHAAYVRIDSVVEVYECHFGEIFPAALELAPRDEDEEMPMVYLTDVVKGHPLERVLGRGTSGKSSSWYGLEVRGRVDNKNYLRVMIRREGTHRQCSPIFQGPPKSVHTWQRLGDDPIKVTLVLGPLQTDEPLFQGVVLSQRSGMLGVLNAALRCRWDVVATTVQAIGEVGDQEMDTACQWSHEFPKHVVIFYTAVEQVRAVLGCFAEVRSIAVANDV